MTYNVQLHEQILTKPKRAPAFRWVPSILIMDFTTPFREDGCVWFIGRSPGSRIIDLSTFPYLLAEGVLGKIDPDTVARPRGFTRELVSNFPILLRP